jgi:hypothetical protein
VLDVLDVLSVPLLTLPGTPGTDWRLLVLYWRCSWFQDPASALHDRSTARCGLAVLQSCSRPRNASSVHSAVLFSYICPPFSPTLSVCRLRTAGSLRRLIVPYRIPTATHILNTFVL